MDTREYKIRVRIIDENWRLWEDSETTQIADIKFWLEKAREVSKYKNSITFHIWRKDIPSWCKQ